MSCVELNGIEGPLDFTSGVAGEYAAYAWEDVEMGAYMDPEFLKSVESRSQAVSIRESSREKLQLDMIPSETGIQSGRATQQ